MVLYYDLPVFKDVYQLILKIIDYTSHFPRVYKFTLGQDLKRDGINLVRSIYKPRKSQKIPQEGNHIDFLKNDAPKTKISL
jgi:hypothetical protein